MDYSHIAFELLAKMQILSKARKHLEVFESLQGEIFVLCHVAFNPSTTLPSHISQEMNISSARVAATLNNLENKGLITRTIDKNDRRKILVEITEAGKNFVENHHAQVIKQISDVLSLLGEKDAKEFIRLVGRLADIISNYLPTTEVMN